MNCLGLTALLLGQSRGPITCLCTGALSTLATPLYIRPVGIQITEWICSVISVWAPSENWKPATRCNTAVCANCVALRLRLYGQPTVVGYTCLKRMHISFRFTEQSWCLRLYTFQKTVSLTACLGILSLYLRRQTHVLELAARLGWLSTYNVCLCNGHTAKFP